MNSSSDLVIFWLMVAGVVLCVGIAVILAVGIWHVMSRLAKWIVQKIRFEYTHSTLPTWRKVQWADSLRTKAVLDTIAISFCIVAVCVGWGVIEVRDPQPMLQLVVTVGSIMCAAVLIPQSRHISRLHRPAR